MIFDTSAACIAWPARSAITWPNSEHVLKEAPKPADLVSIGKILPAAKKTETREEVGSFGH